MKIVESEQLSHIIERRGSERHELLPMLHDIQRAFGHVPAAAVGLIAEAMNLSRADVHGVVSFYHDFLTSPPDRPIVKLCRAEACQARGVEKIAPIFEAEDKVKTVPVYCLGLCASGPAAMFGDEVFARLDGDAARRLLRLATA
ncbi:NAD(P)H-dependent oxidoreductase subunit E [Sphingosinicella rhizophila]|uniref:NAD(P)H-dependent oxidoreductase subunit E n=1 Tax=Sphingosinicella rhizophila TaxID=3050082 RepID=A0ABU3Q5V6_9SPHN|nr:NAD(P)H-dependent oxidoreductase subunit E [Sphingosinicella sp. GR2756]MDT9598792.1 NAD(P)H-dependent oxidoreductase subunit E [Sphingosinicella sp. GR2756]